MNTRIQSLKAVVQNAAPGICPERALLWTDYFKNRANRKKPMARRIAEATRHVLVKKSIFIYPDELIVGNYTSKRVGGIIYPELAGLGALLEIFKFHKREVNPLETSRADRWGLAATVPFWFTRNIPWQAFQSPLKKLMFAFRQLTAREYQVYEAGGIAHLSPDYETLLRIGTNGLMEKIDDLMGAADNPAARSFYEAARISAKALVDFGERYAILAQTMAEIEDNPERRDELLKISDICRQVPQNGAGTFHEAVQSMLLAHIALFQESMGETICPGRLDQILFPYYQKDMREGRITRDHAREILAAFCIKLCETVPVFPDILTKTLGGLPSYQVVTVGGVDENGNDSTNALSYILLEIMDELRMRQPNFHVRIHDNTPKDFYDAVIRINTGDGSAPAMYNDTIIIETMVKAGYLLADARNYVAIGCVEPTAQGKTLGSTDAAIINMPLALELALNEGRRFGWLYRSGAKTPPVVDMTSMDEVTAAYQHQLRHQLGKLMADLQAVEKAHARFHPIPMTSMLINGCLENGVCATRGGAAYNFSGIQGVGISTVGDSLYAIARAVFQEKRMSLDDLVKTLKKNFDDEKRHVYLRRLDKFGNNHAEADHWTRFVADDYARAVAEMGVNTRGGKYNAGLYSNTTHVHFGSVVGALPNGRRRGQPFASGIAPENGMDKKGPTALVNSMNRLDFTRFANGINFNIKFDASTFRDEAGRNALGSIFQVYFNRGGMQAQVNMLNPEMLQAARDNPDLYPNLLVRISGYSAYFNDLSPRMKDEIISRSFISAHGEKAEQ